MATETKFTPGPWHYSGLGEVIQRDEREFICNTKWDGFDGVNEFRNARWEQNAHLIAAAPDLYAALEAIIAWEQSEDGPFAWEVLGQAKSALAKARGEVA